MLSRSQVLQSIMVTRICIKIIFHLSKLWKAKFSLLCDVIFLLRLQGNFDIDPTENSSSKSHKTTVDFLVDFFLGTFNHKTQRGENYAYVQVCKEAPLPSQLKEAIQHFAAL